MLGAVRSRLAVLANRYLSAYTRIGDAYTRSDGILPEDCEPPQRPEPPRLHEVALRYADPHTWRKWTTEPYWPHRIPVVSDNALRKLNPSETLALLEHLEDMVEQAESAADAYVGVCHEAEREHYTKHEAALHKLASMLNLRPSFHPNSEKTELRATLAELLCRDRNAH